MAISIAGELAFVTGASAGIGAACARALAGAGCRLLLVARRLDRLDAFAAQLRRAHGPGLALRTASLDVRDRAAVEAFVAGLPPEWRDIRILVNNAGKALGLDKLHEGSPDDWDEMIDTNVRGLLYVDRAVIPGMVARGVGHVVHIGSIAGHELYPGGNVYCATKFAVDALTRGLRIDLNGTGVRVTTIDPGLVETEFSVVRFHGDEARARAVYQGIEPLQGEDVADAMLYAVTRPAHVQVAEVILLAANQASARDVVRRAPGEAR